MLKYSKVIDETGKVIVGSGTNTEFYKAQGFKLNEVEKSEVDNMWYLAELCPHKSEEEKQREERQRLDGLTLTPADVERALYKAKAMDFEDLKALIVAQIPAIDIKALSIEFRAKDFYRGAEADGIRLFDVVGTLLGYNSEDMDYLFEHKHLP